MAYNKYIGLLHKENRGNKKFVNYYPVMQLNDEQDEKSIENWGYIDSEQEFPESGCFLVVTPPSKGRTGLETKKFNDEHFDRPLYVAFRENEMTENRNLEGNLQRTEKKVYDRTIAPSLLPPIIDKDKLEYREKTLSIRECDEKKLLSIYGKNLTKFQIAVADNDILCLMGVQQNDECYDITDTPQFYEFEEQKKIRLPSTPGPFKDRLVDACKHLWYYGEYFGTPYERKKIHQVRAHIETSDGAFHIVSDERPHLPVNPVDTDIEDLHKKIKDYEDWIKTLEQDNKRLTSANNELAENEKTLEEEGRRLKKENDELNKKVETGTELSTLKNAIDEAERAKEGAERARKEAEEQQRNAEIAAEKAAKKHREAEYAAKAAEDRKKKAEAELTAVEQRAAEIEEKLTNPDFARVTVDNHLANVLTRASAEWEREHEADTITPVVEALREAIPKQPEKIRDELVTAIQSVRTHYSTNDILNVAICMTQGFLTVFSGSPGCGKTSLCRNMAAFIKLNEKVGDMECRRFVDISVGRGWTSQRDFIGYYNPLSGHFETGNADMYRALQMLDAEARGEEGSKYPLYVLLDEANLSPMEHYWSDFIGICDAKKDSDRVIDCGGGKTFAIPETLRFLATINNDDTTTVLSPRLIDRAWIITLPEPTLDQMLDSGNDELKDSDLTGFERISWDTMKAAFVAEAESIKTQKDALKGVLLELQEKEGLKEFVSVSPRIFNAMVGYCAAAVNCFDGDEAKRQTEAFDFVIAQKLLPQISVMEYGTDSVKKQLERVKDYFGKTYPRSAAIMERIISKGSDLGYYRFF